MSVPPLKLRGQPAPAPARAVPAGGFQQAPPAVFSRYARPAPPTVRHTGAATATAAAAHAVPHQYAPPRLRPPTPALARQQRRQRARAAGGKPALLAWSERLSRAATREQAVAFVLLLALNVVMALLVVFQFNIFVTDSMSRTLHAWQVFFSATPKLTAIGFIWAPLPTILQLPLVLLPPLRVLGLSGNILTAIMGALTGVWLLKIFALMGLGRKLRWGLLAAFALNPMMLFYVGNGLSEMTFIAFTIGSIYYLLLWQREETTGALAMLAIMLSLAFLARYDTVVHLGLVLMAIWYLEPQQQKHTRGRREAVLIACCAPVVATIVGWIAANWSIMGDPLHFARGEYSNAAQIGYQMALLPSIQRLKNNPVGVADFIGREVTELFPVFTLAVLALLYDFARTRNRLSLALALIACSFPVFQAMNMLAAQSAAFLRYFILAIPFGVVLAGQALRRLGETGVSHRAYRSLVAAAFVGLALSNLASARSMAVHNEWGQWNDKFIDAAVTGQRNEGWAEERQIADWLMAHSTGRDILVDDFQGYRIIFFSGDPMHFVATADSDFHDILKAPIGRVRYVLVSSTALEGALNAVNRQYPTLYEQGAEWADLVGDYPASRWRIYRIKADARQVGE